MSEGPARYSMRKVSMDGSCVGLNASGVCNGSSKEIMG